MPQKLLFLTLILIWINPLQAKDPYKDFFKAAKKGYKVEVDIVKVVDEKLKTMRAVLKLGDEKAYKTVCQLFKDSHERVREVTYRSLVKAISKKESIHSWFATEMVNDRDPSIRSYILRLIGELELTEGLPAVQKYAKDRKVQAAAFQALRLIGSKADADLIIKGLSNKDSEAKSAAVWALIRLDTEKALKEEEKILKGNDFKVVNTYIRRLEDYAPDDAVRVAKKMLTNKDWHIKVQAIETLSYHPDKEIVTSLVEMLKEEKYRIAEDLSNALYRMTDKDLGASYKAWEVWWRINKDKFTPIKRARKEGYKNKIKALKNAKKESQIVYHGIPITSDRVTFLIDTSDSQKEIFGEKTRMDKVKEEMVRILKLFKPNFKFNLVSFNTSVYPFSKNPVSASRGNISKAAAWVQKFSPEKRTNVYDAIIAALHPDIDTLILLTDGAPTDGVYVSKGEMLEAIDRWNETHHVVIHTVYIGISDNGAKLLKDISGLTSGQTVKVKEETKK